MPKYKHYNVFFPVWNYAHYAAPYKAAFKGIRMANAREPELEALFIGQVFDMAQREIRREREAATHA